ncbi:NRDE family protein [Stakelama saccharophila]|uniref:NRDE family protein n=1 Tax=Stakelama saccharophila TaxID=3075605 RepID=A0ABZ0B8W0_9SPHN|nr:NRDE family protein [Stakelama sp. W311]WNO53551.1 NRDE family protein [Stakelama sp. W311]
MAVGNRDELHAREALPLAAWDAPAGVIAGRDAVAGGTWLGVNPAGRFVVVTNLRGEGMSDAAKRSRGRLVSELLGGERAGLAELGNYNPFNLIAVAGDEAFYCTNRPEPVIAPLAPGMHGLSNGLRDAAWPKTRKLEAMLGDWLAAGSEDIEPLFAALGDEERFEGPAGDGEVEPVASPIFIRDAVYGTRCSTVVTVDAAGKGVIAERRFDAGGAVTGETRLGFAWSA